jgi:hypothetical protein
MEDINDPNMAISMAKTIMKMGMEMEKWPDYGQLLGYDYANGRLTESISCKDGELGEGCWVY